MLIDVGIDQIEVHQLLMGRDIAILNNKKNDTKSHSKIQQFTVAKAMANFTYVITWPIQLSNPSQPLSENSQSCQPRAAFLVDAAWDVRGIKKYCEEYLGMVPHCFSAWSFSF